MREEVGNAPRVVVLINNYNYAQFIRECLSAVFNQHHEPDLVVFIDDGSHDNSAGVVSEIARQHQNLILIQKVNGGQLSAFNSAVSCVNDDDYVFLLDSDDLWPSDYVSNVLLHYDNTVDLIFADYRRFENNVEKPFESSVKSKENPVFIPASSAVTRRTGCWIGSPTSAISMTGLLFKKIFPYEDPGYWRIRADDVIVFGSSILGASKIFARNLAISYRAHGSNNWFANSAAKYERGRSAALRRLFAEMSIRAGVPLEVDFYAALFEVRAIPNPLFERFFIPSRVKIIIFPIYRFLLSMLKRLPRGL